MSASNTFENEILLLLFNNTNIADIGDATGLRGSTAAGSFFIALHTADPGEAGTQTTSEATYTGYARIGALRTAGGFTVTADTVTNAAIVQYDPCTAGTNTITYFSIGRVVSGASNIVLRGALTASLAVSAGITPSFGIGALTATAA